MAYINQSFSINMLSLVISRDITNFSKKTLTADATHTDHLKQTGHGPNCVHQATCQD